jgi:ribosomal protein L35
LSFVIHPAATRPAPRASHRRERTRIDEIVSREAVLSHQRREKSSRRIRRMRRPGYSPANSNAMSELLWTPTVYSARRQRLPLPSLSGRPRL